MNMGGMVDFVIMVDDVEFIPRFKQVEDMIRLLDLHGLTANNYPSVMENKIFIRDMEKTHVIRSASASDLRADLKEPERRRGIEKYLEHKSFRDRAASNWMEVQAYDPSMFLHSTSEHISPFSIADHRHRIRLIENPRLWANYRTMPSFKGEARKLETTRFSAEADFTIGSHKSEMRIMNRPPTVFDSDKAIRTRFFIYYEEAGYRDILDSFIYSFPIRYGSFLKEAARVCGRKVEVARIYTP
jgi:hypothetical protein